MRIEERAIEFCEEGWDRLGVEGDPEKAWIVWSTERPRSGDYMEVEVRMRRPEHEPWSMRWRWHGERRWIKCRYDLTPVVYCREDEIPRITMYVPDGKLYAWMELQS